MTTVLEQTCADLTAWLPITAELLAQPDTDGTTNRTRPGSRPPWNTAVANAITDIHAAVRHEEQLLRTVVTGTVLIRGGSDRNTIRAMTAIVALAPAVPVELADDTARTLTALLTQILQLPAVDLEERPHRIPAPCPYCQRPMLRAYVRDRRVTCLALGSCHDTNGCHPVGRMEEGRVSGQPFIAWADGYLQLPEGTK